MSKKIYISEYYIDRVKYSKYHQSIDALHYIKPCIGYLVKGNAEYLCNGKKYILSEGDMIYIPKNSIAISTWTGTPEIMFYSITFDYLYSKEIDNYSFQVVRGIDKQFFEKMWISYEDSNLKSLGYFYMFLDSILGLLKRNEFNQKSTILPAVEYIKNNYTTKISVSHLAKLCNLSESNLYMKFKHEMGCSPIEYKNSLLAQEAAILLHKGLYVNEVADQLGFSSVTYFRELFKKFTGKLPKEFKH